MREVTWNGKTVPVKNGDLSAYLPSLRQFCLTSNVILDAGKLRELVLSAQDSIFELEKLEDLDAKMELYDKTFIVYNDALNILRDELRQYQVWRRHLLLKPSSSFRVHHVSCCRIPRRMSKQKVKNPIFAFYLISLITPNCRKL